MCGICGFVNLRGAPIDTVTGRAMMSVLRHRGPEDEDFYVSPGAPGDGRPVAFLGHRRLKIIDLTEAARQPLANEDGSCQLVFNGEIYNFQELRAELQSRGHRFRSNGDGETVLHLHEEEGVGCLRRLRGMFALALWDEPRRTLLLARDRLGKKPLFYYHDADTFIFASEAKAILQDPRVRAEPDLEAIHHFLTYGYVPSPHSAFRGIRKLPPAHYLMVRDGRVSIHRYWSLRYTPKRVESEGALGEELLALLEESVRLRLISDVPLGVLLSGGLDSSAVVALMRRVTSGPIRTFSIGFDNPEYDELAYARHVAQRFGTEHHELVVKPDAVNTLPRLVWHYDEPFADSSAVPSFSLCEMARQSITVALNGDGGDEAFLGYDRYLGTVLAGWCDVMPGPLRRSVARGARLLPPADAKSFAHRLQRFARALALEPRRRYARWLTMFDNDEKAELYSPDFAAQMRGRDSLALLDEAYEASDAPSFLEATVHSDVQRYLADDLLVKMDIASMAHALEVRSPFLDHHVMEFAATLPPSMKLRGRNQKYLLKKVLRDVLPDPVLRRRKMGFGVPIDHWFRHELRDMAHDLLLDQRARGRGYFRADVVRRHLDDHVAGRGQHHFQLWSLLMLELWQRMFIDRSCPGAPPSTCE